MLLDGGSDCIRKLLTVVKVQKDDREQQHDEGARPLHIHATASDLGPHGRETLNPPLPEGIMPTRAPIL